MRTNLVTATSSIIMVALATMFGLLGKPTEMSLIILAGAIAISFLNIDRIQKFKGAGFEAEMKQAVEQVHATVDQLRTLAAASAESTLTSLMADNFFDGTTLNTRLDLHDRLIQSLKEIGVSSERIEDVDEKWRKGVGVIYHRGIRHLLKKLQNENTNSDPDSTLQKATNEFQDLLKFETWEAPSSIAMREFINSRNLMTGEINELLNDYQQFERSGQITRRDIFVKL